MKKTRNIFVSIAMAFMLLLASVAAFVGGNSVEADALSGWDNEGNIYSGEPGSIYYFFDFYPSIPYDAMDDQFGGSYSIFYDRHPTNQSGFTSLVSGNYFDGVGVNCIVIIDIKTFVPDSQTLQSLFSSLKGVPDCKTYFLTTNASSAFSNNSSFEQYLDYFIYNVQFDGLVSFIDDGLDDLQQKNNTLQNTNYLLDGNLINITGWNDSSSDVTVDTLCSRSIFLKTFMDRLVVKLGITTQFTSYQQCAFVLSDTYHIRLLVHKQLGNEFLDICTGEDFGYPEDLSGIIATCLQQPGYACVFGFWGLSPDLHSFLLNVQQNGGVQNLPIYLLEADPLIPNPDGLSFNMFDELDDAGQDLSSRL